MLLPALIEVDRKGIVHVSRAFTPQRLHSYTHFLFCATADARTSCRALITAQLRLAFQLMRAAEDTQRITEVLQ